MGTLHKIVQYVSLTAASIFLAGGTMHAATIIVGVEDGIGINPTEGTGDYNDMIFTLTGNLGLVGNGTLQALTPGTLTNPSGTPFWNNPSLDGTNYNIGYCLLGTGNCPTPSGFPYSNLQYFSNANAAIGSETFTSSGSDIVTLLEENTGFGATDRLYYYPIVGGVAGAPVLLVPSASSNGYSVTFTPAANFGLYFVAPGGFVNSQSSLNQNDPGQQHFAIFTSGAAPPITPGPVGSVPEPATTGVMFALLAFGVLGKLWSKRQSARSIAHGPQDRE